MLSDSTPATDVLLSAKIKMPQNVVYRSFPTETVLLNLQTGKYHGLNATAGKMLELLERSDSIRSAATEMAAAYGQPPEVIEQDMCRLCQSLLERGLIETDGRSEP